MFIKICLLEMLLKQHVHMNTHTAATTTIKSLSFNTMERYFILTVLSSWRFPMYLSLLETPKSSAIKKPVYLTQCFLNSFDHRTLFVDVYNNY